MNTTIQQLKKLTLAVTCRDRDAGKASQGTARLTFYHGIAAEGLSGLEMALSGHGAGERLCFDLAGNNLTEFFGPLLPWLRHALGGELPSNSMACELMMSIAQGGAHDAA